MPGRQRLQRQDEFLDLQALDADGCHPGTAIPPGLWMETFPVTKIQARACGRRT